MFIALVGPDGAGKTTIARALQDRAALDGVGFRYQHWAPTRASRPVSAVPPTTNVPPKLVHDSSPSTGARLVSVGRLGRNLVRFWIGYLRWIRPLLRAPSPTVIVADRWMYNYVGQPYSVAYYGPQYLARLAMRLAPRPHLIAILIAPGAVVAERKSELTEAEADREALRWTSIAARWWPAVVFDATRPPHELARDIMMRVIRTEADAER